MTTIGVYLLIALVALVLGAIGFTVLAWFIMRDDEYWLDNWERMRGYEDNDE